MTTSSPNSISAKLRLLAEVIEYADETLEATDSLEELGYLSDLVPELQTRRDRLLVELSALPGLSERRVPVAARMYASTPIPDRSRNWQRQMKEWEQAGRAAAGGRTNPENTS